jgi:hypothetical protein
MVFLSSGSVPATAKPSTSPTALSVDALYSTSLYVRLLKVLSLLSIARSSADCASSSSSTVAITAPRKSSPEVASALPQIATFSPSHGATSFL